MWTVSLDRATRLRRDRTAFDRHFSADRAPLQTVAGPASRARRQIDLPPVPHFRRARGGADIDCRAARRRGRGQHREGDARARRRHRTRGRGGLERHGRRRRRLRATRRAARFRQFRHRLPAGDGGRRRLSGHRDLRWRCIAAQAADAARARSAGTHGRANDRDRRGRPPAGRAQGRARCHSDRLPAAGGVGAVEIRGAARGPRRAGRDGGDRARGDARSYREDAGAFRRGYPRRAARRAWPAYYIAGPARA